MALFCTSEDFSKLYQELSEKTESLRIQVKGVSMYPFIKSGDYVDLIPTKNRNNGIKKGDIILFAKENHFYLHRVIKKAGDNFIAKGDFSFGSDGNIHQENILAKAVSIERNGKLIHLCSKVSRRYSAFIVDFGYLLQYPFLFFRQVIKAIIVFLSWLQGIKAYRRLIKKILGKDIIIRPVQPEDEEGLKYLYHVNSSDIKDGIIKTKKDGFWLVAQRKRRIIGSITILKHKNDLSIWYIFGLLVKPLFRGSGAGERLAREALIMAEGNGAKEVGLFVNKKAKQALRLYKKLGFKIDTHSPIDFTLADSEVYLKYGLNHLHR